MHRTRFAATTLLLVSTIARGQAIRGVVVDATDRPVSGVVLVLLDNASTVSARALSDEHGEFRLIGPGAGVYRIRTTRIGFRPFLSAPATLAAGETASTQLRLVDLPFVLDTIHTEGKSTCRMSARDSAAATWAVWEQVRAALTAGELTALARAINATVVTYERTLDLPNRRVIQQSATVRSGVVNQPWRSMSPDSLRRMGYVSKTPQGSFYLAPALDVLVSDTFLEDHCFKLSTRDTSRFGIAFEPSNDRPRVPEIRGTAWLDRKSAELRRLEFRYVNVSKPVENYGGGDMEFVRMRDGAWAISRWSIRLPKVTLVIRPGGGPVDTLVSSLGVTTGELAVATTAASQGRDTLWSRPPLTFAGTVVDSLSGAPVSNARVTLGGTTLTGTTDAAGRFSIGGVLPGNFAVYVKTPSLDSVNAVTEYPLVFTDSMPPPKIRVPTGDQLAATMCGAQSTASGMVVGTVTLRGDTTPQAGVRVAAAWREFSIVSGEIGSLVRTSDVRTDERGAYALCGLPTNTALTVSAATHGASAQPVSVRITGSQRFARADLILDAGHVEPGALAGVVLTDATHRPLANVGGMFH
jgi:Carboxypeptidase regulatory-like domain